MVDDNEEHEIKSSHEIRRMVRNESIWKVEVLKEKTQKKCAMLRNSVKTGHRIETPFSIGNGKIKISEE